MLQEVQRMRVAELQQAVSQQVMLLLVELPIFPHAVLYQQPLSAAAVVAQAAATVGPAGLASGSGAADMTRFLDPEVIPPAGSV